MTDVLELKCDRTEWLKSHTLSKEQRKELIDDKVKKVYNQIKFNQKIKETFSD